MSLVNLKSPSLIFKEKLQELLVGLELCNLEHDFSRKMLEGPGLPKAKPYDFTFNIDSVKTQQDEISLLQVRETGQTGHRRY